MGFFEAVPFSLSPSIICIDKSFESTHIFELHYGIQKDFYFKKNNKNRGWEKEKRMDTWSNQLLLRGSDSQMIWAPTPAPAPAPTTSSLFEKDTGKN